MISKEEIRKFVERHHVTTFDRYVDYPSPIYHVIWEGNEYCSGLCGDLENLVQKILDNELLKLEMWFPERPLV
jgi:hypothetical protein